MGILEETSGIFGPGKGWSGDGVEQEQIWKGGLQRRCGVRRGEKRQRSGRQEGKSIEKRTKFCLTEQRESLKIEIEKYGRFFSFVKGKIHFLEKRGAKTAWNI